VIDRSGPDGPEWFFAREKGDGQTAFGWSSNASKAESTVTEHQWGN
jgi:hypothetical protein